MYLYYSHGLLSLGHLGSTNTPLSSQSWLIQLNGDHPLFSTVRWHTNNLSITTIICQHAPKKHNSKKPIPVAYTAKQECGGGSAGHSSTASDAEPPSVPPSYISSLINIGASIYPTQPHNQPEPLRAIEQCHRVSIRLPCLVLDCGRGQQVANRTRARAVTQWQHRSHDGGGGGKDFILILCPSQLQREDHICCRDMAGHHRRIPSPSSFLKNNGPWIPLLHLSQSRFIPPRCLSFQYDTGRHSVKCDFSTRLARWFYQNGSLKHHTF
jgi:hypothetical protein